MREVLKSGLSGGIRVLTLILLSLVVGRFPPLRYDSLQQQLAAFADVLCGHEQEAGWHARAP